MTPYKKFARGLPTTCGVFARWLPPITYKGGNLCGIPLKEVKFKLKKSRSSRRLHIKTFRVSSPNNAHSIVTKQNCTKLNQGEKGEGEGEVDGDGW